MFIVKPELDDEQLATATDRVHQLVVANGGNVTKTAAWGKRRLAYRVGQFREGHYVVSNFDIGSDKIVELERRPQDLRHRFPAPAGASRHPGDRADRGGRA